MSHLLKRTKKSCLKLLRKISTSRQLFVQRLDEEDCEDECDYVEYVEEAPQLNDKQYNSHNNNIDDHYLYEPQAVQFQPETSIEFELVPYRDNVRYLRHTPSNSSLDLKEQEKEPEVESVSTLPVAIQAPSSHPKALHPCSVSLGSQFDGNYHNVVITEPPHDDYTIVKWDINGNSLDDERFDLRSHWDDFDSRWRQAGHSYSQKSSHQSSSCTLETWIDL
ncbi:uncharacterized protein Dwil_GK21559 [Drosophila willistoni]|uniref:GK21559 n=1 Tax=Drosophila willistoni TaxID=7260 RepID=B4MPP9_DROWI|nr:uncharacterized protein LOC6640015 [Drosophila willistoni]EDW74088.1 uncharacterized protein Dwil_GK21559 [Drosophila willistoni]